MKTNTSCAIDAERTYQKKKFPGHTHTLGEWLLIIQYLLNKAQIIWHESHGSEVAALSELRQITAVGVAAMEGCGVVFRGENFARPINPDERELTADMATASHVGNELRDEIERLKASGERLKSSSNYLAKCCTEKNEIIEKLTRDVQRENQRCVDLCRANASLSGPSVDQLMQINQLQEELRLAELKLTTLQKANDTQAANLTEMLKDRMDFGVRFEDVNTRLRFVLADCEALRKRNAELEVKHRQVDGVALEAVECIKLLEAERAKVDSLNQQVATLVVSRDLLNENVMSLRKIRDEKEHQLAISKDNARLIDIDRSLARERVSKLEVDLVAEHGKVTVLVKNNEASVIKINDLAQSLRHKTEQLTNAENECSELRRRVERANINADAKWKAIDDLKRKVAQLESQPSYSADATADSLRAEISELRVTVAQKSQAAHIAEMQVKLMSLVTPVPDVRIRSAGDEAKG